MKNVQVVDGAMNCAYDIFAFTDGEFQIVFPEIGQDIEFIEDVIERIGDVKLGEILMPAWRRKINKSEVVGIHGTLFFELLFKRKYYPSKREAEMLTTAD